jgi:hypothetical protein
LTVLEEEISSTLFTLIVFTIKTVWSTFLTFTTVSIVLEAFSTLITGNLVGFLTTSQTSFSKIFNVTRFAVFRLGVLVETDRTFVKTFVGHGIHEEIVFTSSTH